MQCHLDFACCHLHWTDKSSFKLGEPVTQKEFGALLIKITNLNQWLSIHDGMGEICGPIQSKLLIMPPGRWQAIDFIKNVYEPGLLLFMDGLVEVSVAENCKGLTLIEDGAPIHTAIASQEWHDQHQIRKLNCPPNSPDLNPIENS
ncbi:hypothetical protein O181_117868 [Austropuccinia psidii MF-1]|uniref:Tc1-like transposase DDE domain-containing protein n=1 Tax=Austropuccinia psidii MF-1 TaxID=1389203 RepID=A0A9Q3KB42_9BASI|nr:hypothetical protein [Austropuccinia psidii MF-1]